MRPFYVIVATHSRRSAHPTKVPHPERPSEAEGSFSVVSSTDHHPLNTAHFLPSPLPSLPPIPCPLFSNPCICHTSESPPGGAYSQRSSLQPLSVPTLFDLSPFFSHSCALFCTYQKLNPFVFKRFRTPCKKPPGGGEGVLLTDRLLTPSGGSHGFIHVAAGLFAGITLSLITALKILKIILENFCARLAQAF